MVIRDYYNNNNIVFKSQASWDRLEMKPIRSNIKDKLKEKIKKKEKRGKEQQKLTETGKRKAQEITKQIKVPVHGLLFSTLSYVLNNYLQFFVY